MPTPEIAAMLAEAESARQEFNQLLQEVLDDARDIALGYGIGLANNRIHIPVVEHGLSR